MRGEKSLLSHTAIGSSAFSDLQPQSRCFPSTSHAFTCFPEQAEVKIEILKERLMQKVTVAGNGGNEYIKNFFIWLMFPWVAFRIVFAIFDSFTSPRGRFRVARCHMQEMKISHKLMKVHTFPELWWKERICSFCSNFCYFVWRYCYHVMCEVTVHSQRGDHVMRLRSYINELYCMNYEK